jgi:hypothetical protein
MFEDNDWKAKIIEEPIGLWISQVVQAMADYFLSEIDSIYLQTLDDCSFSPTTT